MSFGHACLSLFALEPGSVYLNHGTVGCVPRVVTEAQRAIQDEIERHPSRFLLRELSSVHVGAPREQPPRLRMAASEVAAFFAARGDDLVFVDNTTTAVNAVLRSFRFVAGDELVIHDHVYGAIRKAAEYVARSTGATLRTARIPRARVSSDAVVDAFTAELGPRTKLVLLDHVTSETALVLPVREVAARCRAVGAAVLVDGAHAVGAFEVDIPSLGVEFYTGNLHKWAFAPRSCALLWVDPAFAAGVHPTTISWGLDQGLAAEFDWPGTRDPSAYLAAPRGLSLIDELGRAAVFDHNRVLALRAGRLLEDRFGTTLLAPPDMIGTMVTVPLPQSAGASRADVDRLRDALLFEEGIEVQLFDHGGRLYTRVSAQIYNDLSDVERLATALLRRC